MLKLAAFADEISKDLDEQIQVCKGHGVMHFELRGVAGKNVLEFDPSLRNEIKTKLQANGMGVACIGSPIGKIKITDPFEPHFDQFKTAVELAAFFGAPLVRIFSYYAPEKFGDMRPYRDEVLKRTQAKVNYVNGMNVTLVHENEKAIYGEKGIECLDLMKSINSPKLRSAFDFSNFVQAKEHPLDNWAFLKPYVTHIHIKDALMADGQVVPAGQGDGQMGEILADAYKSGYRGFLSLEPHLKKVGQFSGFSGPKLFGVAVTALKDLCRKHSVPLAGEAGQ